MQAKIFTKDGKSKGEVTLPEEIFGLNWNADLVHQVVTSMMTSKRMGTAHTKDRGEVSGGGKKPWAQKGTGRARHGSSRSPIWVGGGVAHGPRNDKNFDRKINKKAKLKAISTILSLKLKDGEILFIDSLGFTAPKTKEAVEVMKNIASIKGYEKVGTKRTNALYIATPEKDKNVGKSFANIGKSFVTEIRNINPLDLMKYKYLVIENPEVSIGLIKDRLLK